MTSVSLLSRGWIVPVGDAIPDRRENLERHLPEMNLLILVVCLLFLCFRVGGSFRSGVQPPTGIRSEGQPPTGSRLAQGWLMIVWFF